jgi:hypothetical protein
MCWSDFPTPLLLRYTRLNPKQRAQCPNLALALRLRYKNAMKTPRSFNWPFFTFWLGYAALVLTITSIVL